MHSFDHIIADDLKQMAINVAGLVYNTVQRNEKLTGKEMPKPVVRLFVCKKKSSGDAGTFFCSDLYHY